MVLNWIEYPSKPIEIENPNPMVYAHTTIKGIQSGLFLGAAFAVVRNLYKVYYSKSEKTFDWNRVGRYSRNGVLPLVVLINAKCYSMLTESVIQKNQSRAFRIYYSKGQNLSDDMTLGGLVGGLITGALWRQKSKGQMFIFISTGGLLGLLANFSIVASQSLFKPKH